jgi:hypothetical protein
MASAHARKRASPDAASVEKGAVDTANAQPMAITLLVFFIAHLLIGG